MPTTQEYEPFRPDTRSDFEASKSIGSASSECFRNSDSFRELDGSIIQHTDFYDECHPFGLNNLSFHKLPTNMQNFLTKTHLYPNKFANLEEFFLALLEVRHARRDRLERTLEGVNRAIVNEMLASHIRSGDRSLDERSRAVLRGVLQPEWREHLDQYVEEIDALIWLDLTARADSSNQLTLDQYMIERRDDVAQMVEFALRCLQGTLDKVRTERKGQWLLDEMMEMNADPNQKGDSEEPQGHISDLCSDTSDEEGQWVSITPRL